MIKLIICLATFLSYQILAQNSCLVCEYYNLTKTAQSSTRTNHHSQRATENTTNSFGQKESEEVLPAAQITAKPCHVYQVKALKLL